MTSTSVTQAAGLLLGGANVSAAGSKNAIPDVGFSQVMSRTSQNPGSQMQQPEKDVQGTSARTPVKVERSGIKETSDAADQEIAAQEEKISDPEEEAAEADETVQEILAGAIAEVKTAIQEELGISAEQLDAVMEELGLTEADLLQPDVMQAIAVAAAGETDELCVLTNAQLYESIQNLKSAAETVLSDVKAQLGMEDAEVAALLQKMENSLQPETMEVVDQAMPDNEIPVVVLEQEAGIQEQVGAAKPEDAGEKEPGTDIGEKSLETSLQEAERTEKAVETGVKTGKKDAGADREAEGGKQNHFLPGWSRNGMDIWDTGTADSRTEIPFETVRADDIMNQVTEYMKVEVKSEMTQLELQLQPETLGTLHIHLSAREGAVTAQFIAENEAVKSVLEAQATQLKENLSDQGIKVEAVEVTVASHEFNRSFAENGENGSRYEEPKKKSTRRIRLDGDIPLDDMEFSEEDRIAAEMMEQNGNTVDYMA